MKTTDIAKIRQLLKTVRDMVECPHRENGPVDGCDFCKRTKLLDEALALLPCSTCNGDGQIVSPRKDSPGVDWELCPDCT